jgi:hypothetical protein
LYPAARQYAKEAAFWKKPGFERAASSMPKQSIELLTWVREMTLMQQGMAALLQLATLDAH